MGFPILICFYIWFSTSNPDPKAFYGKINDVETLFPSKDDAEAQGATDIHPVHRNFVCFYIWGILNILPLYVVGIFKDWVLPADHRKIDIVYNTLCAGLLL